MQPKPSQLSVGSLRRFDASGSLHSGVNKSFDADTAANHPVAVEEISDFLGPLPVGLCVASVPDARILWANDQFERIMGCAPISDATVESAPAAYRVYDRAGNPYPPERFPYSVVLRTRQPALADDAVVHRADGKKLFLRTYAQPVFDSAGELCQVSTAFVDITREVQAELERDSTSVQLRLALAHAPIVIWAVSREGRLTVAQGAGLQRLEAQFGPLLGRNVLEVFKHDPSGLQAVLERVFRGESFKTVVSVAGAMFDTWASPVYDAGGNIVGASGVSHDVRELKQLQSVAMQADRTRAVGVLAASVAHEINNPLTYMLPCCDYLASTITSLSRELERTPESIAGRIVPFAEQLAEDLSILRTGLQRIATIAGELRSFTHSAESPPEAVDPSAVVRSVLQLVGKEAAARAHLVVQLDARGLVTGHPSRLTQVVLNLLTNAMHSLSKLPKSASKITIRSLDVDEHVVLEVADSGVGIPESRREQIFEPFVTSKKQGEGTGLGLFVSRNIVQQYGGTLTAHASDDGGALFRVKLPHHRRSALTEPPATETSPLAPRSSVLIIDDEPDVGKALVRRLVACGHDAVWFPSVADAVANVGSPRFDVIFCDLMMAEIDGLPWHEYLAHEWPNVAQRVVVMTGGAFSPLAREFAIQNAERLVEKPFDVVAEVNQRRLASGSSARA